MKSIPKTALALGYAGVVPFALFGFNLLTGKPLFIGFALQAFMIYSAVILSFLGGIRWAFAISGQGLSPVGMIFSTVPSLIAFGGLLLPDPRYQVLAMVFGFTLMAVADHRFPPARSPEWMQSLRLQLSVLVLLCHIMAVVGLWR